VLPRLQDELLPGPFSLGMLEALDEADGSHRGLPVKVPSLVQRLPEVIVVAFHRQLHQLAGQDPFAPDILCVMQSQDRSATLRGARPPQCCLPKE